MSIIMKYATVVLLLCACSFALMGQSKTTSKSPLEGVWKVSEVVITGNNARTISAPQPGLYIFTKTHYSIMFVSPDVVRPKEINNQSPDADRLKAYDAFTANSGTYEVKGTTYITHPLVAKNPNAMTPNPTPTPVEFKVEGNTLWVIQKSAPGQPASETRRKL